MANLNLYFSIISDTADVKLEELASILPNAGLNKMYKKGDKYGIHTRKESIIDYKYIFKDLTTISEICRQFMKTWEPYADRLENFDHLNFRFLLLFEFVIFEFDYPALIFEDKFLQFLTRIHVELQLYFYNE